MIEYSNKWSVWAGGVEVNDYSLTLPEAKKLAEQFLADGYPDVAIENLQFAGDEKEQIEIEKLMEEN